MPSCVLITFNRNGFGIIWQVRDVDPSLTDLLIIIWHLQTFWLNGKGDGACSVISGLIHAE